MKNIVITGSGRSGTSLAGGLFAKAGYFMGDKLYIGIDSNPKGFFESPEINAINEEMIAPALERARHIDSSLKYGQRWLARLPADAQIIPSDDTLRRIKALTDRAPVCFKDPRFAYTIQIWRPLLGDLVCLCIFRDPATTVSSILKECEARRDYLKDVPMTREWATELWTVLYERILDLQSLEGEWHFLHYDQLSEETTLDRLEDWTGAKVDRDFPEKGLKRSTALFDVPPETEAVYRELCKRAGFAFDEEQQLRNLVEQQDQFNRRNDQELSALRKSELNLKQRLEQAEAEVRRAQSDLEALRLENLSLKHQIDSIFSSKSWKLAGPFRRISRLFRSQ